MTFRPDTGAGSYPPPPPPPRRPSPRRGRRPWWIGLAVVGGLVVVWLVVVAVGAVTGADRRGGDAVSVAGSAPSVLPDRDRSGVSVALRRLDACALIDEAVAAAPGSPGRVMIPAGPHACVLAAGGDITTSELRVEIGADDPFSSRYDAAPATIGGAKAYVTHTDIDANHPGCVLDLPVSHSRAIQLSLELDRASDPHSAVDACGVTRRFAAAAVAKLAHPDSVALRTTRAGTAWDGCALLGQVLGPPANPDTLAPNGPHDPFSGCRGTGAGPRLEAGYGTWPPAGLGSRTTRVDGHDALTTPSTNDCWVSWNQGASGVADPSSASLIYTLTAADCDTAQRLATRAAQLAATTPPTPTAPRQPLLYEPGDNDTGAIGPCLDFSAFDDCAPAHPVPVPRSFDAAAAASLTDPAVQCAAFADAIHAAFGPSFSAVVSGQHCFFVEPTHTVELRVNVDGQDAPDSYGHDTDLDADRRVTQIAGHPAVTFWSTDKTAYDIYLSPRGDITRPGNLHLTIHIYPPRGSDPHTRAYPAPLDPASAARAERVMAQVAQGMSG